MNSQYVIDLRGYAEDGTLLTEHLGVARALPVMVVDLEKLQAEAGDRRIKTIVFHERMRLMPE